MVRRIAIVTASLSRAAGGIFPAVVGLARALHENSQYHVDVLGLMDEHTRADAESWNPVQPRAFPSRIVKSLCFSPALSRKMWELDADLAHCHSVWMFPAAATEHWARRNGRPYLVSTHGMLDPWALRNSRWKKSLVSRMYADRYLRKAPCLHALCDAEMRSIREAGYRQPICVAPNAVDIPTEPATNGSKPRCDGKKRLLYLGRLHPKKGLVNLITAWADWKKRSGDKTWRLAIAGWDQGNFEADLKRLAAGKSVDSIDFLGPQMGQHKSECFRDSDAFILPSLSEGLPMAVLEAWAYGLPVLMTAECNLPIGFHRDAALQIVGDIDGIARGIDELVAMTDTERSQMGGRGKDLVREEFSWPRVTEKITATYDWLLSGGAVPSTICCD